MIREDTIAEIYAELSSFARRSRALSGGLHPDLSLVAYTLLAHINSVETCRAADLADHYSLDKSTVSRQLADLQAKGLTERIQDTADRRVQVLKVTSNGKERLREAQEILEARLQSRLGDWTDEDLEGFAALLARFNRSLEV